MFCFLVCQCPACVFDVVRLLSYLYWSLLCLARGLSCCFLELIQVCRVGCSVLFFVIVCDCVALVVLWLSCLCCTCFGVLLKCCCFAWLRLLCLFVWLLC